jgi:hypothetical protein
MQAWSDRPFLGAQNRGGLDAPASKAHPLVDKGAEEALAPWKGER